MRYPSRRREVPYFQAWFEQEGYQIITLASPELFFEGHGDAIWHPDRQLLWGGYGQRTAYETYPQIHAQLQIPIVTLALVDPRFYHLDTCFCPLDEETVMLYAPAFDAAGLALIHHFFPRVIEIPTRDASSCFAANAVVLDHKQVVIQAGAKETIDLLTAAGFLITTVDTQEFIKSGGSAFCLKMLVY
jgi:N-dimethylarginine dimethylaminohydrolase